MDTITTDEDLEALEAFVTDNDDLKILEGFSRRFNLFEALGVVHREMRHSDTLAFLLCPNANHSLNEAFLSRFLKQVASKGTCDVSVIDVDVADLANAEVRRE